MKTVAEFERERGRADAIRAQLPPVARSGPCKPIDPEQALPATEKDWRNWSERCTYPGRWRDAVVRSLITLKALTYAPTGGIVAAPTTSLPEQPGGVRNWDYRYCWLRDATFTLNALLLAGYQDEAVAWREWLLRAVAGSPEDLQMLYSVTGERRLDEYEIDWLPGYGGAGPVRVGNAAIAAVPARRLRRSHGHAAPARAARAWNRNRHAWRIQVALLEVPGVELAAAGRRHLGNSRAAPPLHPLQGDGLGGVRSGGQGCCEASGSMARSSAGGRCAMRSTRRSATAGYDAQSNTFVQSYGSPHLDASLLLIPQVGFLPPDDPRVRGTVDAIERHLVVDGLVLRYSTATDVDHCRRAKARFCLVHSGLPTAWY